MRASLPQKTHADLQIAACTSIVLEKLTVVELDKKYSACFETKVRYRFQQLASDPSPLPHQSCAHSIEPSRQTDGAVNALDLHSEIARLESSPG